MAKIYQTPGIYIEERSAFPNSAVPVATAVPAFIGYTEKAVRDKKPLTNKPTKISSFGEFLMFFGGAPKTKLTVFQGRKEGTAYQLHITSSYFTLHSQMKMFFSNGGTDCYIVSVGEYTKKADGSDSNKVEIKALIEGIMPLLKEMEPSMLVIPELANILRDPRATDEVVVKEVQEMYTNYAKILDHCGVVMRNRFAILDVWMDRAKYQNADYDMSRDINLFRENVNSSVMAWGAAYYPWLETTAVASSEVDVMNVENRGKSDEVTAEDAFKALFNDEGQIVNQQAFKEALLQNSDTTTLSEISLTALLDRALNQDVLDGATPMTKALEIKVELRKIEAAEDPTELTKVLLTISPMFKALMKDLRKELNLLPPSGAMAGIYSMIDNSIGVFQSPANIGVGSVIKPALSISSEQQEDLNLPIDGKAVNAIRSFPGKGVLVWGARTLDGNSQDWRYISVRRTVIFIEQSIKYAAEPYVFEPNTASTWSNMKAMLVNFLTNVWQSGALAGATAEDAFSVDVGLGNTMTPVDILDGYMRISVKIAVTRPAEFIVITFEQKMQQS
jgi:phage tail sheath protein FI